jgi:ATP-dependent protease ClpP protease subunit
MTDFRLVFNGGIEETPANALRARIAQILERPDCQSLTILFSSSGGSCAQGLSLYNFIRALPKPIRMHAIGVVESMAVPVFLSGHERTCSPLSRFFFHTYDYGFTGRQTRNGISEALAKLDQDIELSRQIVGQRATVPEDLLSKLYSSIAAPTLLSPQEAKGYGIVTDICELNAAGEPQPNVAIWTVGW